MLAITISLVLLVASQDADYWIGELGEVDIARRDKAELRLKALGDVALPVLRRAERSENVEVAARARAIIRYLDRKREILRILDPGEPFSFQTKAPVPLADLLKKVGDHFGVQVDASGELSGRKWSGTLDKLKLLPLMDRLVRDLGLAYAVGPGRIRISPGKPPAYPADMPGSFKVFVRTASLYMSTHFPNSWCRATFEIGAVHQSRYIDVAAGALRVQRVLFDTGDEVRMDLQKEEDLERYTRWPFEGNPRTIQIPNAPPEARLIRSVRGVLAVEAPATFDVWRFDTLKPGTEVETADAKATLVSLTRGSYGGVDHVIVFLSLKGKLMGTDRLSKIGQSGRIDLLSKDGKRAPVPESWPPRHRWNAHFQTVEVEARFLIPRAAGFEPGRLVVRLARDFETVELPFEIRDVPLR